MMGSWVARGAMNRNDIKDDWENLENSAKKEGTDKGYKSMSGQCFGDTHFDIMDVKHGLY